MVANSRCSAVAFRPAAMRTHAFTRREWTSNPAHRGCKTSISLPPVSQGAGVESAGTKSKSRDPRIHRARNAGCSRDSGSNYRTGSRHHRETDLWASIKPYTIALPVSCMRGSGARRVGNYKEREASEGGPLRAPHVRHRAGAQRARPRPRTRSARHRRSRARFRTEDAQQREERAKFGRGRSVAVAGYVTAAQCNRDAPDRGANAEKQRRWRERRAAGGR